MRTIFAPILAAFAVVVLSVLPAAASVPGHPSPPPPRHPVCTVTITDQVNGILTTGGLVHTGEVVKVPEVLPSGLFGQVAYKITVVKDAVPDVIKLSPSLPKADRGDMIIGYC